MSIRNCFTIVFCSSALFIVAWAQDASETILKLSDATTYAEVIAYINQEVGNLQTDDVEAKLLATAGIWQTSSEKMLAVAKSESERRTAYNLKVQALQFQINCGIEEIEKMEILLNELAASDDVAAKNLALSKRFEQFSNKARTMRTTPENYAEFMNDLKPWVNNTTLSIGDIANLTHSVAERNKIPVEQYVRELSDYVRSADALSADEKTKRLLKLESILRLILGSDPKLYGKTLDDKDFEWEKLRKKYVLIKFTATWCGPCQLEIPGMLEAYELYHDKGLEIVSVYMAQREPDPVGTVKNYVEGKKLPWIIISEELSKKAGHPAYGEHYNVSGIPTMVLVNPEGKIILTNARGIMLKNKLAEIFK